MSVPKGLLAESQKYEVIRELGRGGMGVVYLAEDRHLKREVALKVLYEHLNRDGAFVERFQEEARAVSTLHHPNIVCVHGLERAGEIVAIDMEYVEGQSLAIYRESSKLTTHRVAGITGDILSGLATCHQIGVVHRDIKPSNILISAGGLAKITDFGLAKAYASHMEQTLQGNTSSGFYMGTPRYMPVAAWEGGRPEPYWDLYSLGVVLFELLSGRVAFAGESPLAIMRQHLTDPLPPLQSIAERVSPEFCALVDTLVNAASREDGPLRTSDALTLLRAAPEFQDLQESNVSTTITLPQVRLPRRKRSVGMRLSWRGIGPALAAIALLFAFTAGVFYLATRPPIVGPQPAVAPALGRVAFLDVVAINDDTAGAGTWMVELGPNQIPTQITGFTDRELMSLTVSGPEGGGVLSVSGDWGACLSPENRTAYLGSLKGTVLWERETGRLTAHLDRIRERDLEPSDLSLSGRMKPGTYDRAAFVHDLEDNAAVQGLLYRELLVRRLPWAEKVEALMPAQNAGRVGAPKVSSDSDPDGALDEEMWRPLFDRAGLAGELTAAGGQNAPRLLLRWSPDAVYVGARVPKCGPSPSMEIAIMPAFEMTEALAPHLLATISVTGLNSATYTLGESQRPWSFGWDGRVTVNNDAAEFELRIPSGALKDYMKPDEGHRWRLNARVSAASGDTLARWGAGEFNALHHGAIVVLEGPPTP